jgi:hypothetical protein
LLITITLRPMASGAEEPTTKYIMLVGNHHKEAKEKV